MRQMVAYGYLFTLLFLFKGTQGDVECTDIPLQCPFKENDWMTKDKTKCVQLVIGGSRGDEGAGINTYCKLAPPRSSGGTLLTIEDEDTNQKAKKQLINSKFGKRALIDIFPAAHNWTNYTDWKKGEPKYLPKQEFYPCGVITTEGWEVVDCTNNRLRVGLNYFCEYPSTGHIDNNHIRRASGKRWSVKMIDERFHRLGVHEIGSTVEIKCVAKGSRPTNDFAFWWINLLKLPIPFTDGFYRSRIPEDMIIPLTGGRLKRSVEKFKDKDNNCYYETTISAFFRLNLKMNRRHIGCLLHNRLSQMPRLIDEYGGLPYTKYSLNVRYPSNMPIMEVDFESPPNYVVSGKPFLVRCRAKLDNRNKLMLRFSDPSDEDFPVGLPPPYKVVEKTKGNQTILVTDFTAANNNSIVMCKVTIPPNSVSSTRPRVKTNKTRDCLPRDSYNPCKYKFILIKDYKQDTTPGLPKLQLTYDFQPLTTSYVGSSVTATCNADVGTPDKYVIWVIVDRNVAIIPQKQKHHMDVKIAHEVLKSARTGARTHWISNLTIRSLKKENNALYVLCFSSVDANTLSNKTIACPKDSNACTESEPVVVKVPRTFGVRAPFRAEWNNKAIYRKIAFPLAILLVVVMLARRKMKKMGGEASKMNENTNIAQNTQESSSPAGSRRASLPGSVAVSAASSKASKATSTGKQAGATGQTLMPGQGTLSVRSSKTTTIV